MSVLLPNVGPSNYRNVSEICLKTVRYLSVAKNCQKTIWNVSDVSEMWNLQHQNVPKTHCESWILNPTLIRPIWRLTSRRRSTWATPRPSGSSWTASRACTGTKIRGSDISRIRNLSIRILFLNWFDSVQGRAKELSPCLKIPASVLPGKLASPCTANQPISESLSSILWT